MEGRTGGGVLGLLFYVYTGGTQLLLMTVDDIETPISLEGSGRITVLSSF